MSEFDHSPRSQDERSPEITQMAASMEQLRIQNSALPNESEAGGTAGVREGPGGAERSPETRSPHGDKKLQKFLTGRIKDKKLEDVPSIGPDVATGMRKQGITTVDMLFAKYLEFDRDEDKFVDFYRTCGSHSGGAKMCFKALEALCEHRLL